MPTPTSKLQDVYTRAHAGVRVKPHTLGFFLSIVALQGSVTFLLYHEVSQL